jgi:hypothetical protein
MPNSTRISLAPETNTIMPNIVAARVHRLARACTHAWRAARVVALMCSAIEAFPGIRSQPARQSVTWPFQIREAATAIGLRGSARAMRRDRRAAVP